MEQISNETNVPAETSTPAENVNAAETTAPAAPVRRRSRRATAATGEVVAPAEVPAQLASESSLASAAEPTNAEEAPAPKKRATRSRKKAVEVAASEAVAGEEQSAVTEVAPVEEVPAPKKRATRSRKKPIEAEAEESTGSEQPQGSGDAARPVEAEPVTDSQQASAASADATVEAEPASTRSGNQRGQANARGRSRNAQSRRETEVSDAEDVDQSETAEKNGAESASRSVDATTRSSRTRQRERKRRGQGDDFEPEITEDDVLLPIAGILDVLDNYAFVRTSGYLPGTNDVYVSLGQVKKYGLRKGDAVVGAIRQPRESEGAGRQKYNAIVRVDSINSRPVPDEQTRADFDAFTPIHPDQRLRLETARESLTQRVIDVFAPIGFGQRGLVLGNSGTGKTEVLRQIAAAVAQNHPEAHLMMVSLDARPEEVTELQRSVNGEVIAATFDRPAEDQITVAELAVERAKRLVELGHDVVLLLDSVTGLGRALHLVSPAAVRLASARLDPALLGPVKRLLGAARNLENGGSLTIIATANARSASHTDELILEELAQVWNTELLLNEDLAVVGGAPAVDLIGSATRRDEVLRSESEAALVAQIRRSLSVAAAGLTRDAVLQKLADTSSNVEFLTLMQRELPRA